MMDPIAPDEAASTSTTEQPHRSIWQQIWRWVLVGGGCTVILLVAAVALAWYALMPQGELRLALSELVQADSDKRNVALSLFHRVHARAKDVAKLHARLSFVDGGGEVISLPPPPLPGKAVLRDIVTRAVLQAESSGVSVSVDAIQLLELLYSFTGKKDFFLVLSELEACGATPVPGAEPPGEACYRVTASVHDVERSGRTFVGTSEELVDQLAVYMFKSFLAAEDARVAKDLRGSREPFPHLQARALPDRMAAIQAAAEGIWMLEIATAHTDCDDNQLEVCLQAAEAVFERALDPALGAVDNPPAVLGAGLLLMRRALDKARQEAPVSDIEALLARAANKVQAARLRSAFLSGQLDSEGWLDRFKLVQLGGTRLDADLFRDLKYFDCAMSAYRKADGEFCIRLLEQIDGLPDELLPYVDGPLYETRLRFAEANEAKSLFQNLLDLQAARPDSWFYNRVIVAEGCRRGLDNAVVNSALDRLRQSPPDRERALEAKVLSLLCDISAGRIDRAMTSATALDTELASLDDDAERHRLELQLAVVFTKLEAYEKAAKLLISAAELPYTRPFVFKSPDLEAFKRSGPPFESFLETALTLDASDESWFGHCRSLEGVGLEGVDR